MSKAIVLQIGAREVFVLGSNSNQQYFQVIATDEFGQTTDVTKFVSWESSNPSVVEINEKGIGTVKQIGESTVKAIFNDISREFNFKVKNGTKLTIQTSNPIVEVGDRVHFNAMLELHDGEVIDITNEVEWSSSNESIATIDKFAKMVILSSSSIQNQFNVHAKFTATLQTSLLLTVRQKLASEIQYIDIIAPITAIDAGVKSSYQLTAISHYATGFSEDITHKVTWSSSNSSIATISDRGVLKAVSNGSITIRAEKNGRIGSVSLNIINVEKKMISFEIIPKNFVLPWQDGYSTLRYKAIAVMENGEMIDVSYSTTWESTFPITAPITPDGLALSKTKGTTTIKASYGGFNAETSLTIGANLTNVEIVPQNIKLRVGEFIKLEAIAHFSDYPSQNITNYANWVSSDSRYLSTSIGGIFYGERVGNANVRTYFYGITTETRTTVDQAPIYIENISIDQPSKELQLQFKNTMQFSASAHYNNKKVEDITTKGIWKVSDESVASIDANGLLTSQIVLEETTIIVSVTYNEITQQVKLLIKPVPLPDITPPGSITHIRQENTDTTMVFNFRLPTDIDFYSVKVYRDGVFVGETKVGRFFDSGLKPNTNYLYEFSTLDTLRNESERVKYYAATNSFIGKGHREPLEWTGNIIVNQNNQVYSTESNRFPTGDANDQTTNPYLVSWHDIKCQSCESIYQMMRNHVPLGDFKTRGWGYVLVTEGNSFPTLGDHEIDILHYMKADELQFGSWCRECGSTVYSKIYMKEFDSRVELGMTFFPSEQKVPKYTFKLPSSSKFKILNNNSIGNLVIYEPNSKTYEELSITTVMPSEHFVKRSGENFAKITINLEMTEISVEFLHPEIGMWEEEISYILSINKNCLTNLNTIDQYDVLQAAAWENKLDGTPTKLHRTYAGFTIMFNYAPHDSSNDFDPEWPYYVEDEEPPLEIIPEGIRNLYGWGDNSFGQIGDGTKLDKQRPVETLATDIIAVSTGKQHSIAVQRNGLMLVWGRNTNGQLGFGSKDNYYHFTPTTLKTLDHIKEVAAGWFHSLALEEDGTVWSWGGNYKGQLGDGSLEERSLPVQVKGPQGVSRFLENIVKIGAGSDFSVALDRSGKVWQWGRDTLLPEQVPELENIIDIATGAWHTLALKSDGTVWSWGYNWSGQLGIGVWEYEHGYTPNNEYNDVLQVQNLSGIVAIAAGNDHSLALTSKGTIFAWGDNEHGQIGTTINRNKYWPIKIPSIEGIIAIGAGEYSTFAIKNNKTVWGWGDNSFGQLGIGSLESKNTPQQISTLDGWDIEKIEAGGGHTVAVKVLPGKKPTI